MWRLFSKGPCEEKTIGKRYRVSVSKVFRGILTKLGTYTMVMLRTGMLNNYHVLPSNTVLWNWGHNGDPILTITLRMSTTSIIPYIFVHGLTQLLEQAEDLSEFLPQLWDTGFGRTLQSLEQGGIRSRLSSAALPRTADGRNLAPRRALETH